ncbi:hypothetical protein BC962_2099 [Gillisia mitskevichiae]|uniref:Uncharacterized protein n=1 Tax=Gillisia mitskevichiae TaxID=270921 RepID=A0A495PVN1_9FLAO|nr:hypothetical protein [Gillisia mitskevichiae]RKS53840.1 hypothetical protein BC962_2099 [Gillisia mitskevichiae]
MKNLILLFTVLLLISCKDEQNKETPAEEVIMTEPDGGIGDGAVSPAVAFAQGIENAHNKADWSKNRAVSFDISLTFDGQERLNGKITSLTNSSKIRVDKNNNTQLIFDGNQVYLCPADADEKGARFDMFTWQYFFSIPFKLTDPGTNWESLESVKMSGNNFDVGRLTFGENIGDAPDDWYVIYQERETGLLHGAGYIVTFGSGDQAKAEENPHGIVYSDYEVINGIPVATKWSFHNWNLKDGFGEKIGEATLSNIVFFNAEDKLFEKPEDSKLIEK